MQDLVRTIINARKLMRYNVLLESNIMPIGAGKTFKRITSIKQLPWHYARPARDHGGTMSVLIDRDLAINYPR